MAKISKLSAPAFALALLVLLSAVPHALIEPVAGRLRLDVSGTRFTLNGKATFLLGISYYSGLGASEQTVSSDLSSLKQSGFNWLRVWATWRAFGNDISVTEPDGRPRVPQLQKLRWLVGECERNGMAVDVTLSRGDGARDTPNLQGLDAHRRTVEAVVGALKPMRNWYLDLSNERNIRDGRFTSFEDLGLLRRAARSIDPETLITASHGGDISPDDLRRYVSEVGVDFISPHRPRDRDSALDTEMKTREYLDSMKQLGRVVPVHYQEPLRRGYGIYEPKTADYMIDLQGAVRGGASGWCFHNGASRGRDDAMPRRSFDLRGGPLLDVLDPTETEVFSGLKGWLRAESPK